MIARQFFNTLSYIFHPLFMPLMGLYFLFALETRPLSYFTLDALFFFPTEAKYFLYVIVAILTALAPMLSLFIMYYNKIIGSLTLEKKEDRTYPFLLIGFYYVLAYFYVRYQIPPLLQHPALLGFLFGVVLVFLCCFLLNFKVKISIHAAAVFGVSGMLLGYSQTQLASSPEMGYPNLHVILYLFFVAGLVSGGRIFLKAHSLKEIFLGAVIGFGIMYVTVKYGLYI